MQKPFPMRPQPTQYPQKPEISWRLEFHRHRLTIGRGGLKELVRRGIDRQIFSPLLDEELSVALLLGPMVFRHIFRGSVDKEWLARGAVDLFWRANARNAKGTHEPVGATHETKSPKRAGHKPNGKPAPAH